MQAKIGGKNVRTILIKKNLVIVIISNIM